jgi:uncharacterized protein (TIGR00251 family)
MVEDLFDVSGPEKGDGEGDETVTVTLRVHVQPGAGRTAVAGRHGTSLKVRVAAPPEGGRANEACAALLAETFGVAPSAVELVSGASSRMKRFRLRGVDLDEFTKLLTAAVDEGGAGAGPRRTGHV